MRQTFWDVRHVRDGSRLGGLYCNGTPLRRDAAERLLEQQRAGGYNVEIVPTHDELWEQTYGDKP